MQTTSLSPRRFSISGGISGGISRLVAAVAVAIAVGGSAGCDQGVDFDADVAGHAYGRAGGAFGSTFQVVIDFRTGGRVTMSASQTTNGTIVKDATAACDLGDAEVGLFETRVPGTDCVFESSLEEEELPPTPDAIVMGFRNFADNEMELDPSLEEDLPSPFSFIDSYNTVERVDDALE